MAVEELEQSRLYLDMFLKERREVGDVNLTHEKFSGNAFTTDWPREVVTTEGVVTYKLCAES